MPAYIQQPAFSRGEISPRLYSRVDISHYALALKECTNFIVMRQGGLMRRPGTEFILFNKDGDVCRLIPFVFSTEQAYILEFGENYARVYANGAPVISGTHVEFATPYARTDLADIQFVQSADVLFLAHPDYAPRQVNRASHTSWSITSVSFKDGPFGRINPDINLDEVQLIKNPDFESGIHDWTTNNQFVRWDSSFKSVALTVGGGGGTTLVRQHVTQAGLQNSQCTLNFQIVGNAECSIRVGSTSNGVDYVADESLPPGTYTRTFIPTVANGFWVQFTNTSANSESGPAFCEAYSSAQTPLVKPLAVKGSGVTIRSTHSIFASTDVGRLVRLEYPGRPAGWAIITAFTNSKNVVATIRREFATTGYTEQWRLGAFSDTTGYPGCVGFYQERLAWARTNTDPQTLWFSKSAELFDYGTTSPTLDTDAITVTILSESVSEIRWIKEDTNLLLGTTAGIRSIGPADQANAFSSSNILQRRHASYGVADIQPIQVGSASLFATFFRDGVREAAYSFEADSIVAPEVTILAEHIFKRRIVQMAFTGSPYNVLWCVLEDGTIGSVTYERDQEMFATHKHTIAGGGFVESIAAIPGTDGDELWLSVKRTLSGVGTKRYIERLPSPFDSDVSEDAFFVDSGLTYDGAPAGTFSNLDHLEGETVAILGDGAVYAPQVVNSGSVTLPNSATVSKAAIGLAYTSRARMLEPPVSRGDGSGVGRKKTVTLVKVDLYRTGQAKVKTSAGAASPEIIGYRDTLMSMGEAVPLVEGWHEVRPTSRWKDSPGEVELFCDAPLPCTIRSVMPLVETEP